MKGAAILEASHYLQYHQADNDLIKKWLYHVDIRRGDLQCPDAIHPRHIDFKWHWLMLTGAGQRVPKLLYRDCAQILHLAYILCTVLSIIFAYDSLQN